MRLTRRMTLVLEQIWALNTFSKLCYRRLDSPLRRTHDALLRHGLIAEDEVHRLHLTKTGHDVLAARDIRIARHDMEDPHAPD